MEKNKMSHRRNKQTHLVLGGLLIFLGIGVISGLFSRFGDLRGIIFSWQMLLIGLGVIFISSKESKHTGYILVAVGSFFIIPEIFNELLDRNDLLYRWKSLFWPVMLILIGFLIIFNRGKHRHRMGERTESGEDYLDDVSIFGGGDKIIQSQNFKGGRITNIFGGSKYNLTNVHLAEGTNYLEVIMIFGGSKFIVPEGWDIRLEVTSIFGGFSDRRMRSIMVTDPDRSIVITGITLFGGGEIINY